MSIGSEVQYFSQPGDLPAGSVSTTELATQAADTFLANVTSGVASPTAVGLSTVTGGGGSISYDATNHRFVYSGSSTTVALSPTTGAVGVLDISTLLCGGVVSCQPTAACNIDGFTAKSDGFWFYLFYRDTTAFAITLNENAGATTTSIRCPGNAAVVFTTQECVRMEYRNSRWRAHPQRAIMPGFASGGGTVSEPFTVYVPCASGGASGTADDVTVWNAAAPFALRIIDASLLVSTAVALSTAALRTASGGGGSVVLPDASTPTVTFSTGTVGPHDQTAVATATVASGGSLFLRRSDRSVVGELILTCIRT